MSARQAVPHEVNRRGRPHDGQQSQSEAPPVKKHRPWNEHKQYISAVQTFIRWSKNGKANLNRIWLFDEISHGLKTNKDKITFDHGFEDKLHYYLEQENGTSLFYECQNGRYTIQNNVKHQMAMQKNYELPWNNIAIGMLRRAIRPVATGSTAEAPATLVGADGLILVQDLVNLNPEKSECHGWTAETLMAEFVKFPELVRIDEQGSRDRAQWRVGEINADCLSPQNLNLLRNAVRQAQTGNSSTQSMP